MVYVSGSFSAISSKSNLYRTLDAKTQVKGCTYVMESVRDCGGPSWSLNVACKVTSKRCLHPWGLITGILGQGQLNTDVPFTSLVINLA